MGSSQGSTGRWTAGSMSTQSSQVCVGLCGCVEVIIIKQDELPECLQLIHDWAKDYSVVHRLIPLSTFLQIRTPKQFQAASEFCKMSGLVCSYGLYQVH